MILPTIIGVTESAVRSVPESYYEGSLALGAKKRKKHFLCYASGSKVRESWQALSLGSDVPSVRPWP